MTQEFRGLGVCAGIVFGHVHLVDRRRVAVPRYHISKDKVALEIERFEHAVEASERQLSELRLRAATSRVSEIDLLLQAHGMMLRDPTFFDATRERILKDGQNAEWALKESIRKIRQLFNRLDEDYFRERRSDVDLVGDRVMRNLVGAETELLSNLTDDAVVVAYDLSPADAVALARYKTRAFVSESGGRTSHLAILARAMNIPAVLGVRGIVDIAGFGDSIVVDGGAGSVVLHPSEDQATRYRVLERRRAKEEEALRADRALIAETSDGVAIDLSGNLEVADEVPNILQQGGAGIGLYRTEFLVIERHRMPTAEEHALEYRKVVAAVAPREVTIRTIDIGGDKFVRTSGRRRNSSGANPALGLRAIRYSLRDRESFRDQLIGILEASALGSVRILFPLVTSVVEVREAKALLEETKADLRQRGVPFDEGIKVGVMVETPAAVMIADLLAREVDFFSIGTNDLIQYALAVDRGNDDVAYLYRPSDPAVLRMIRMVSEAARSRGIPVTICGEMAADPFHVPLLLGLGVTRLSMTASSIPLIKRIIRRLSAAQCRELSEVAVNLPTAQEVDNEVATALRRWVPELFQSS